MLKRFNCTYLSCVCGGWDGRMGVCVLRIIYMTLCEYMLWVCVCVYVCVGVLWVYVCVRVCVILGILLYIYNRFRKCKFKKVQTKYVALY